MRVRRSLQLLKARKDFLAEQFEVGHSVSMADMAALRHHQQVPEAAHVLVEFLDLVETMSGVPAKTRPASMNIVDRRQRVLRDLRYGGKTRDDRIDRK